jgi:ribosomal protein L18E
MMSRVNRPPLGLARVSRYMSKYAAGKIAVIVGTVTDDVRLIGSAVPKLRIAALRFTAGARARIEAAGGQCLTFDQLALLKPTGTDTVLLRGRRTARVANRYFGVPGAPGSKTRPRVRSEGRKVRWRAAHPPARYPLCHSHTGPSPTPPSSLKWRAAAARPAASRCKRRGCRKTLLLFLSKSRALITFTLRVPTLGTRRWGGCLCALTNYKNSL